MRLRVAIAAVSVVLGSCSFSIGGGLDTDKLEGELKTQIEAQTGATVDSVACPDDIKAEAGGTFTCSAVIEGNTQTISVVQDDDEGNVTWELQ